MFCTYHYFSSACLRGYEYGLPIRDQPNLRDIWSAAVAKVFASSAFNILVGLGLRWFIAGLVSGDIIILTDDVGLSTLMPLSVGQ